MSWMYMLGLGLVAGYLGKILMPGKDKSGCLFTMLLGVAGSFLGGYIGQYLGWGSITGEFDWRSIGLSVGGVILLLILGRLLFGGKKKKKKKKSKRDD